jgi:hypothetical protein
MWSYRHHDIHTTKFHIIDATWGVDKGGQMPSKYFCNLGIVFLVTELNNGK